jgi:hypothetical protein
VILDEDCREAALDFHRRTTQDHRFVAAFAPELDIVVFAPRTGSVSHSSALTRKIFVAAARRNLHLAVAELPVEFFAPRLGEMTCLRSVLMKQEHRKWMNSIWQILDEAAEEALRT